MKKREEREETKEGEPREREGEETGGLWGLSERNTASYMGRVFNSLLCECGPQGIINLGPATSWLSSLPFHHPLSSHLAGLHMITRVHWQPLSSHQMHSNSIYTQNRNYLVLHAIWNSASSVSSSIDTSNQRQLIFDLK